MTCIYGAIAPSRGTGAERAIYGIARREQLESLAHAAKTPNITIRLLPFNVVEHPGVNGAFSVLEFPDPDDGRTVWVEALTSTRYIEQTRQVGIYRSPFEQIQSAALGPDETAEIIATRSKELRP